MLTLGLTLTLCEEWRLLHPFHSVYVRFVSDKGRLYRLLNKYSERICTMWLD